MNAKRVLGITVIALALLLAASIRITQMRDVAAEAPRVPPPQPVGQPVAAPAVRAPQIGSRAPAAAPAGPLASADAVTSPVITQTFTLQAGWNAIYLEVEPVNTSPLVNQGTAADPIWVHEKSTMETVFADLAASGALESVWGWNVPTSRVDYIVDPTEGLWDEPGWRRYVPESKVGPDGVSQGFLTNLLSLHANTAYLVKLKDDLSGPATLAVRGAPIVQRQRWIKGSYNLAGFPIAPGAAPTVATFTGGSPITEIRQLTANGSWTPPLAGADTLAAGVGYLVYYGDQTAGAPDDYTAPLQFMDPLSSGLAFTRGAAGRQQSVRIENLTGLDASVTLALTAPTGQGVALWVTDPVTANLAAGPVQIPLGPHAAKRIELTASAAAQHGDGAALLAVTSAQLGVRWLLPVRAERGSLAGLWVGEATVNDVSEGRLGATDVEGGQLTIALRPQNNSGIRGAVELQEKIAGNTSAVGVTLTLALPSTEIVAPRVLTGAGRYVRGYLFVDANQNGERDGAEAGLAGRSVVLTPIGGGSPLTATTGADGLYLFENLAAGDYAIAAASHPPTGYTAVFSITVPARETGQAAFPPAPNAWPEAVTLGLAGVDVVTYRQADGETYEATDFPRYDATGRRVEPHLNFGYVSAYSASLWTGLCNDRREQRRNLGVATNGILKTTLSSASLNPPRGPVDDELLGPVEYAIYVTGPDGGVACGEIAVGAPTRFANGAGSDFTFRLILRVNENNRAAILPYYALPSGQRVSSANFSISGPVTATNAFFGDSSALLDYLITIAPNDPLNPYKHKYHPDHDNLDAKFNAMDLDTVDPWLWESYEVTRRIKLELTELPPYPGATPADAVRLDWGGTVWGGLYREVIKGLHKNDITVKGYFVIRQVAPWEQLKRQPYDGAGGGG